MHKMDTCVGVFSICIYIFSFFWFRGVCVCGCQDKMRLMSLLYIYKFFVVLDLKYNVNA